MADEDDQAPREEQDEATKRAPWMIKSVRVETREAAVTAAMNRGRRIGTWMEGAVWYQVRLDAGKARSYLPNRGCPL